MAKLNYTYLDSNSTTELSHDVSGLLMDVVLNSIHGNPSSLHTYGVRMRALVESSRNSVAASLNCDSSEIIFTSGGTESNNIAIRGSIAVSTPAVILVSAAEHSSVYNTALDVSKGGMLVEAPLLPSGALDMEFIEAAIDSNVNISLLSIMMANNETGALFPIKRIVDYAQSRGILVHCDAVQAYGKIPIDVDDLGVDLLSISGHKAHALPGVGALYIKKGTKLRAVYAGGYQERALRPGTENYIGIATLGVAAEEISIKPTKPPGLRDAFEKGLLKAIPGVSVNAKDTDRVYNTSSIVFKGVHASAMVEMLAEHGVFVSSGSACSSGIIRPSRTLKSMGLSDEDCLSTIRFSFSQFSCVSDVVSAIEACVKCCSILRG